MGRSQELQTFIDATRDAFAASGASADALAVADRIFGAANASPGEEATHDPVRMPVCDEYLDDALERARTANGPIGALAEALAEIAPRLTWVNRPNGANDDDTFKARHANAVVVGEGGLEARDDIRIGMGLLAPETRYPDHRHPPEELYTVMSPGEWKQNVEGEFRAPGIGGFVHNIPNIIHGMRATDVPLLAVWSLWMGDDT
jgi:quercetin dioxygenase-like cupin family protein